MTFLRGHNGETVALILAAACAWAIASSVTYLDDRSMDAVHIPGLAAGAAVATTWVLWRLIAAYGRRLVVLRAAIAGGLAGIAAHPVFVFLLLMRDLIAACEGTACLAGTVFTPDGFGLAAFATTVFTVFGLAIVGPVTVPVGMLGGVLAVLITGSNRPAAEPDRQGDADGHDPAQGR